MYTPLNYVSNYSHSVFIDDFDLHKIDTPISSDFGLEGFHPAGSSTYIVTATVSNIPSGSGFLWEVSEVDVNTGAIIPNTTLSNPSSWWSQSLLYENTFPGYCCQSNITTGNGIFLYGHKYKITRGTWGPCSAYNSTTKYIYLGPDPKSSQEIKIIENEFNKSGTNFDTELFSVFPNPITSECQMFVSDKNNTLYTIEMYSLSGSKLSEIAIITSNQMHSFSFDNYPTGMYIIRAKSLTNVFSKKIIVQH